MLALTLLFLLGACTQKQAQNPETQRLKEDIKKWEAELEKGEARARAERENAPHINAEMELIRSRIERLKERLKASP